MTLTLPRLKKFTFNIVLTALLFTLSQTILAQNGNTGAPVLRCGTSDYLLELMRKDPTLKARMEANQERLNQALLNKIQLRKLKGATSLREESTVTIPVVVHIVLPDPTIVTDADVAWQISKMNTDFAGLNADSVLAGPFASLFGHSGIQFCLAQQDPNGNPTNGIDRVNSSITFTRFSVDDIKSTTTCGANSWDATRYFNIWVGTSTDGTLGIATFPDAGIAELQGIAIMYKSFGNNPAYVYSAFNLGRTAVHETGHYFFARHIWGDGVCSPDFPTVSGLPDFIDDTPPQSGPTSGCPSGTTATGCSGASNPPGRMYQNYMDYTNDACYCMFTLNQVARMEAALDIFRASLKTSNACTPATLATNDAALAAILKPFAGNCSTAPDNSFCTPFFAPSVRLKNTGSATLTSVVINAQVDNLAPVSTNWNGSLVSQASTQANLNPVTAGVGLHTIKIYVTNPNNTTDQKNSNDTLYSTFTISAQITGPVTEDFESPGFPPANWRIINPGNDTTWALTTAAAQSGLASAFLNCFNYSTHLQKDYLLAPPLTTANADSIILSFNYAYQRYDNTPGFSDSLAVVVSLDCGSTFTEVWKKGGDSLASVPGFITSPFMPDANGWATAHIDLKSLTGPFPNMVVGFESINNFGQNLYIDNINLKVYTPFSLDASISGITEPLSRVCTRSIRPAITLTNNGTDTLKSATIVYIFDNTIIDSVKWTGQLATSQNASVQSNNNFTIPAGANHTFMAYVKNPNGSADINTKNDSAKVSLLVSDPQPTPIVENFNGGTFPPAGWSVSSSGSAYTWEKTIHTSTEKVASAEIRDYRFNSGGKHDDLYSPLAQPGNFDSVAIRFDVSYAIGKFAGSGLVPLDTLEVLLTTDCGKTFTSVYKKGGVDLQTTGNPNVPNNYPAGDTTGYVPNTRSQWRTEYINVTQSISANTQFQVVFRNTSNNGNNVLLDNVNIYSVVLPQRLKEKGYLIAPNPFGDNFVVRHLVPPANLKAILVFNATGQLAYNQQFNGNAGTTQRVDVPGSKSGIYFVKLIYTDKIVTEKIIKR